jgi:biopolymer transport protein ExbD
MELAPTSMIDVVFLLLIFFIATTTFLSPERQLRPAIVVERPAPGASEVNIEPLAIEIVQQDATPVFRIGATISPDMALLLPILEQYPDKSAGAWIRLSDEVPFSMAAVAINACQRAGFDAISLVPLRLIK